MKFKTLILPTLALGGAALLLVPSQPAHGWATLGFSLGTGQRDFRVFNNFTDASANNNQVADDQFPGFFGADMAIWKGCVEWGSEAHGDGTGDPLQSVLGSGGANYDAYFAGASSSVGGINDNVHSEISGSSGGTLAFAESPSSNGWRIRYYSGWTWQDGPGSNGSVDLQGVACHEQGHALGLNHSNVSGATMWPSISGSGTSARSINNDDSNGVKAIYGTASASKPSISGVTVNGSQITISGSNFSSTGNEIWFTQGSATGGSSNPFLKLTNITSSGGNITVTPPAAAGDGDVMVKVPGTGGATLSNAFPVDLSGGGGGPGNLAITSISPGVIGAVNPGTDQFINIFGSGFSAATTTVEIDGIDLAGVFPAVFQVVSSSQITVDPPDMTQLGLVVVTVRDGSDSASTLLNVLANNPPALEAGTGDEPVQWLSATGLDFTMGGAPGDTFVLGLSFTNSPSSVPGLVSIDIGNNFSDLYTVGTFVIPASGYATTNLGITLPPVTTVYFEGVTIDPGFTTPLPDSNEQEALYIF